MNSPLGELATEEFLDRFWQKKPCLIRNAMPDYQPSLNGDDLAGLSCEEYAESRLVSGNFAEQNWSVQHGPFDEATFAALPDKDWTLLVQDVEKHYPPLQDLMDRFDFLPNWRLDDLMISFAVTGGSVGPHVDQYDVFLFQAQGQRLWKISESFKEELLDDCPLTVLKTFEAEKEWILKPGDMLYLPPNVAHHGIALDEGMTWSIGLRAPSVADLYVSLGEFMAARDSADLRYADPESEAVSRAGEVDRDAIERFRKLMTESLENPATFNEFLGAFITRFRLAQEPVSPDPDMNAAGLLKKLESGYRLHRNPWTRLSWIDADGEALLFAAGAAHRCSIPAAQELCSRQQPELFSAALNPQDLAAVVELVNGGHLVLHLDTEDHS